LVARVQRDAVIGRIGGVDLDSAIPGHEGSERLIEERRIREL
jgi:hypothetical protein